MLLRFGVANHRSIRDYQELLFTATKRRPLEMLTMPVPVVDESVVPVTALFGGNASGKSNVIDAMDDLRLLVDASHRGADETTRIPRSPFRLDANSATAPTRFECSFTVNGGTAGASEQASEVYDLEVEFTAAEIRRECLRRSVRRERRSQHTLYERVTDGGTVTVNWTRHLQGDNDVSERVTRPNSLFLSAAAQNNHPQLTRVHRWFADDWRCVLSSGPLSEPHVAKLVEEHEHVEQINRLFQQANTGVASLGLEDVELDERARGLASDFAEFMSARISSEVNAETLKESLAGAQSRRLRFLHDSASGPRPMPYSAESRGTRMFLTLLLPALDALSTGGMLIVDELDSSLHPQLAQAFVSLFLRRESNPNGAQLVFSSHDVALLGCRLLGQDDIWVVDKDIEGVTSFTPLTDFHLDPRANIERAYRDGRFGGTPDLYSFLLTIGQ